MLPKVSAALSKFVTPIQTTSAGSSAHEKEFVRTQPERKAKVIPIKGEEKQQHSGQQSDAREPEVQVPDSDMQKGADHPSALGSSFLGLFDSLRQNSSSIFKWIGANGYRLGVKATRRSGRLRKGAMLDVKVD